MHVEIRSQTANHPSGALTTARRSRATSGRLDVQCLRLECEARSEWLRITGCDVQCIDAGERAGTQRTRVKSLTVLLSASELELIVREALSTKMVKMPATQQPSTVHLSRAHPTAGIVQFKSDQSWNDQNRTLDEHYRSNKLGWSKLLVKLGLPAHSFGIGVRKTDTLAEARRKARVHRRVN
jgi:hypothetical protein